MKSIKVFLLIVSTFCYVHATSFTPRGIYAEDIIGEISQLSTHYVPESITTLNLQDKPLAFASEQYIFDYTIAESVINKIVEVLPNLEVLDLSLNRLPQNALPSFLTLLSNPKFKFLDVRINSGANTLNGLQALAETIEHAQPAISLENKCIMLQKIIWLSEDYIPRVNVPEIYKESHRAYYKSLADTSSGGWTLPTYA